jgi:hypothetical protein
LTVNGGGAESMPPKAIAEVIERGG